MKYQQLAEYIEECQRKAAEQESAYMKAKLEHEFEMVRISLETQLKVTRLTMDALTRPLATIRKVTVAM